MFCVPASTLGGVGFGERCPAEATSWPDIFGPNFWWTYHVTAQNFQEKADPAHRQACESFVGAIPYMLPCDHCGRHFREFIVDYSALNGSMCEGRVKLANFFCQAQNQVNQGTGKPIHSCCPLKLQQEYGFQPFCAPIV